MQAVLERKLREDLGRLPSEGSESNVVAEKAELDGTSAIPTLRSTDTRCCTKASSKEYFERFVRSIEDRLASSRLRRLEVGKDRSGHGAKLYPMVSRILIRIGGSRLVSSVIQEIFSRVEFERCPATFVAKRFAAAQE